MIEADSNIFMRREGNVKPFLGGLIGYQWQRESYHFTNTAFNFSERDNFGVWGLRAGVEMPVGSFAITPAVSYSDTMVSKSDHAYHYSVEAHHWFTEKVGGYANLAYNDLQHAPNSLT